MGLEIDFLPVGDGETSGDAIAFRYGNLFGSRDEQTVGIIDGGFADDGEALVEHVHTHYGTDVVDLVFSTHPDRDHISGLKVVLVRLDVRHLCMHLPWNHSAVVESARRTGFRSASIADKFERNFEAAAELEDLAQRLGISVVEPFAGMSTPDGGVTVLSPTRQYYEALLGEIAESEGKGKSQVARALEALREAAAKLIPESLHIETLTDWGETSPQNNSSTVLLLQDGTWTALFTADAGMPALNAAADGLEERRLIPGGLGFIQVPHHGSRRNVGPTVLNRLLGPKGQADTLGTAFVSAAKESRKHPAKKVTNAFRRRGYPVHGTDGNKKLHHMEAPDRGWGPSVPYQLHALVEEDEG